MRPRPSTPEQQKGRRSPSSFRGDAAALSRGADDVAEAIAAEASARKIDITIVRNGTRGMVSLEPLVEVALPDGRVGYGPVSVSDIRSLFDANFLNGGTHPLNVGLVESLPYFKKQERLTAFARAAWGSLIPSASTITSRTTAIRA